MVCLIEAGTLDVAKGLFTVFVLLYNVYVLYSSMEERHLAEWGGLNSNQI